MLLKPYDLHGVVRILRRFDKDGWADGLIEDYISARSDEPGLFALHQSRLYGEFTDEKLLSRFAEAYDSCKEVRTLKDVLARIADTREWDPDDERVLADATTADYFQLFKNERGPHLHTYVELCLGFPRHGDQRTNHNAVEALKMIANENRLNTLRVTRLRVKL